MTKLYDNSRISDHRLCNRYYYFRHVRHWTGTGLNPPLLFGAAWHGAMDVVWGAIKDMPQLSNDEIAELAYAGFLETWREEGGPDPDNLTDEERDALKARVPDSAFFMLGHYIERRRSLIEKMKINQIERPFAVPIYADNPNVLYVGRIDKDVEWEGREWGIEHKHTAWGSSKGISPIQLETFNPSSQVDGYIHAMKMLYGPKAKGILVDIHLVNKADYSHCALLTMDKSYEVLDAWLWELQMEIASIEANFNALEHERKYPKEFLGAFPRNTGNCIQYMRPCPYMDVCKSVANPDRIETPRSFVEKKWEPFNELKLAELGVKPEE